MESMELFTINAEKSFGAEYTWEWSGRHAFHINADNSFGAEYTWEWKTMELFTKTAEKSFGAEYNELENWNVWNYLL
jgi:hypothetical protein